MKLSPYPPRMGKITEDTRPHGDFCHREVGCIPNIDIDLNEFRKYIKLIVQTKRYKMNAKYKILE